MNDSTNKGGFGLQEGEMIQPSTTQLHFRPLRADEVDVRPATGTNSGSKMTLLLYQDARCAMNILDSTFGPKGWQRKYYEAAGMLFCDIGIWDQNLKQWLWKSDTGSKSNIEEDKGQASDAFKRAAVVWGIGRELYTAPKIIVELTANDMFNDKLCQTFRVSVMTVSNGVITELVIVDKWGNPRYEYPKPIHSNNDIPATHRTSNSSQPVNDASQCKNELRLRQFCESVKNEPGVDLNELDKFLKFYLRESDMVPGKSRIAAWKGQFNAKSRWESWMAKKYQ